jgi:Anti-sigma factor NepR
MDIVPTDEKNVRRAIRTGVGDALRSYYGDALKETVPSRFSDLLRRLDELDKAYPENQE